MPKMGSNLNWKQKKAKQTRYKRTRINSRVQMVNLMANRRQMGKRLQKMRQQTFRAKMRLSRENLQREKSQRIQRRRPKGLTVLKL